MKMEKGGLVEKARMTHSMAFRIREVAIQAANTLYTYIYIFPFFENTFLISKKYSYEKPSSLSVN